MNKSIITILMSSAIFLVGCESNITERSIGFVTGENSDTKWHLGTQDAIDIVSTVDALWANQEYEAMRPYFADSVEVIRPNGLSTDTFDAFIESISSGETVTWSYNYAFSVDLDPSIGGEHVQAGFSVDYPATDDREEYTTLHHESYYVVDGKIINLRQYAIRGGGSE
jgi:hypothetical protein